MHSYRTTFSIRDVDHVQPAVSVVKDDFLLFAKNMLTGDFLPAEVWYVFEVWQQHLFMFKCTT